MKAFLNYLIWIEKNKEILENKWNLRIDNIYRLYTIINMPNDVLVYGQGLSTSKIENYIKSFRKFLEKEGMSEFFKVHEAAVLDEINYKLVFGFSLFDQETIALTIIACSLTIPLIVLSIIFKPMLLPIALIITYIFGYYMYDFDIKRKTKGNIRI